MTDIVSKFLLETPLYAPVQMEKVDLHKLYGRGTLDGYCPFCDKDATFKIDPQQVPAGIPWNNIHQRIEYDEMSLECVRSAAHKIRFYFKINKMDVRKIGQFPSLADIAISEIKQKYKSVLQGSNWSELYKAIGLAAHGEGIGAFVYLRRVFESLIFKRFEDFKNSESWIEEDFKKLRMNEKINFMKDHLPDFLVQNSKIYSIFSQGIHELDNDTCSKFFEVGKQSILIILEEDLRKKEDLERREKFKAEIAQFSSPMSEEDKTEAA